MKRTVLALALLTSVGVSAAASLPQPAQPTRALPHCQIPCGIYGDATRIDLMMEDAATIEKGMKTLMAMEAEESPSQNQMVRWVMNKDQHAQAIQDQVAAYWLAQRIKKPQDGSDAGARERYVKQLMLMHGITVAAMKCKQTTDVAHVAALREHALEFSATYFSGADLEHIRSHHGDH